jgi:hypothetical protein
MPLLLLIPYSKEVITKKLPRENYIKSEKLRLNIDILL